MKPFLFFSIGIILMLNSACNGASTTEDGSSPDTTSSAGAIDTTGAVIDYPHQTDSIPGDKNDFNTSSRNTAEMVRKALAEDILKAELASIDTASRKFSFYEFDLNGDGQKEVFVKLTGPYFCGSGGCSPLLLSGSGKIITKFTVVEYPIIIASTATKGWMDIIVTTAAAKPTAHLLKYNGTKYPGNPSVQPIYSKEPGKELPRVLDDKIKPAPDFSF